MKRLFTLMIAALATTALQAQTARRFTVNISPDGAAKMEAFLPDHATGRAIVDCPGGGYSHLAVDHEGYDWASYFNKQGIAYFVLTYRMPKGDRTIPLGDAQTAIRTVRDSARTWGVNPLDVGIMGFSAGGHLASAVSTHSEYDCRPDFTILFYPVISMDKREGHRGSAVSFLGEEGSNDELLVKQWSSQNSVRSHLTPPAIILAASDDGVVPVLTNGMAYYSAMRRAGNDCALYVYPSGGHGFGFRSTWTYHEQMLIDLACWLAMLPSPRTNAVRVACIGNSITHGSGIDMQEHNSYPAQLQRLLGDAYYVKNYGVGARTMLNSGDHPYMKEMAWRDALAFRPDVVVIKLGTNDAKDYNWNAHKQEFEADMQQMIDALSPMLPVRDKKGRPTKTMVRSKRPVILLCTPIKAFRDKWGITDSVIVGEVAPAIRRVAQRNGLTVVDLHDAIADEREMTTDMIHPSAKGAARLAETIAEEILKLNLAE